MFKLLLHTTEKPGEKRKTKVAPLLDEYLSIHKKISREFESNAWEGTSLNFSTDLDNPDLLVKRKLPKTDTHLNPLWWDRCAFEFKFGMDLVSSLNSKDGLRDQLTRMKCKYFPLRGLDQTPIQGIPLYIVIVNEWKWMECTDENMKTVKVWRAVINEVNLARANTIAANLNIRVKYCDTPNTFAENVFDLIRFPPKEEIDLGQRFVKKSSGSEWNQSLQCYGGVSKDVANKIERYWNCMDDLTLAKRYDTAEWSEWIKKCFATESGRFMKANMEKFLRKVSGK